MARQFYNDIALNGLSVTGLRAAVANGEAVRFEQISGLATEAYTDSAVAGLPWKDEVKVATIANINLTGTQSVDGVALSPGWRVLAKDQTVASENGIYIVDASAWTRAEDFDANSEIDNAVVPIHLGTINSQTMWRMTSSAPIIDTDALNFTQFNGGSYTGGDGITLAGLEFSIAAGDITEAMLETAVDGETFVLGASTFTPGAGTVAETDSVFEAMQKLQGNITAIPQMSSFTEANVLVPAGGTYTVTHSLSSATLLVQLHDAGEIDVQFERTVIDSDSFQIVNDTASAVTVDNVIVLAV